jgi:hypothetical protein
MKTRLGGLDDLTVAVVAAVGADAMRELDLAALGAHGTCGGCDLVVLATTCVGDGTTGLTLRHCHD